MSKTKELSYKYAKRLDVCGIPGFPFWVILTLKARTIYVLLHW